jgi:hypothetical protein
VGPRPRGGQDKLRAPGDDLLSRLLRAAIMLMALIWVIVGIINVAYAMRK